jgi:hypothetical protein
MVTAAPSDLSDLVLPADELEREAEYERRRNGTLARCECEHPMPAGEDEFDGSESCFSCGQWIKPPPRALSLVQPADEPAEGDVPWSRALEESLKAVVKEVDSAPWKVGDLAVRAIPVGKRHANNGSRALVRELATRVDLKPSTLQLRRLTSAAWPPATRCEEIAWGAHAAYRHGGAAGARKRARRLRKLAEAGPVTADRVREELLGNKRCQELRDPTRSAVQRLERLAGFMHGELGRLGPSRMVGPAKLREAADQARAVADALAVLAEGGTRDRLAAIAPRLR